MYFFHLSFLIFSLTKIYSNFRQFRNIFLLNWNTFLNQSEKNLWFIQFIVKKTFNFLLIFINACIKTVQPIVRNNYSETRFSENGFSTIICKILQKKSIYRSFALFGLAAVHHLKASQAVLDLILHKNKTRGRCQSVVN